ncbi:MAG TPA: protein kinase [Candidatus Sulfotelmatobacter sp.]
MSPVPTKIGKYDVEGILGRGGMGVVYKAKDAQIGRYVAIKMINSGGDPSLVERFKSEAKTMGSLQCPNIATVYNVGDHDGNPYLVMQYLEGPSLESIIRKGVSLTLPERLGIIIDVCNGLDYAHDRGVIHRDIKPANIIVLHDGNNDGTAVIVDFGIARIVGDTHLTMAGQVIGSICYMSPEQLQARDLDNRSDVYSTGVVLFQLLTGVLPFDAEQNTAIFPKILNDPPPSLSAYVKDYPAELDAIVTRVLAKKPTERYASAKDLAFDLAQVQGQVKSNTVSQLVKRAEAAFDHGEWTEAREQLEQALRIDRRDSHAKQMMNAVHERIRLSQEIERARTLRSQANDAYNDKRYDEALRLLDQAVALDPKNNELASFREVVRASRERAIRVRLALQRAEAALNESNLDLALSAIDEAFTVNPHDTQAKALKVVVSQRAEEKSRQDQMRKWLGQAHAQIAARDLTAAFATLQAAEALDPTSNELQAVIKIATVAREQERRRSELEALYRHIEQAMVQEDYATAAARAEEGLRRFPQEPNLIKLKGLAQTQQARVEQRRFAREQFAAASSLADSGQLPQALAMLDRALQKIPGNNELETLRSMLRDRAATEDAERRYAAARVQEELEALDRELSAEPNPAKRVQLAEEAARSSPDNPEIQQRLEHLYRMRAQIREAIDQARGLEIGGHLSEAVAEWQALRRSYPRVPEFESEIRRLEGLLGRTHTAATLPPPAQDSSSWPETASKIESQESSSATRVFDSSMLRDAGLMQKDAPPAFRGGAARAPESIPRKLAPAATMPRIPDVLAKLKALTAQFHFQQKLATLIAGPRVYVAIPVAVIVLALVAYLLFGRGSHPATVKNAPIQIHIVTNPPDALVTSGSQPIQNGMVLLVPGESTTVVASRLGYRAKTVALRQASDGTISLEPEPIHLSVQTAEKNGSVQLDGQTIADLSDGNLEEYDFVPDGNSHELSVTAQGKRLFAVQLQAAPGSLPQVGAFDANGLFLITSLGGTARLYAGSQLRKVLFADQSIAVSSSGTDLTLSDQAAEIKFGEGSSEGSVALETSNAPALAVYSTNVGGQVQITSSVEGATLKINGTPQKSQRHTWLISRPPGTYQFELSADGYESQQWTMTIARQQNVPAKKIDLKPLAKATATASLVVAGGTSDAQVEVDGKRVGELDTNGNLKLANALTEGKHTIGFSKGSYEGREVAVVASGPEVHISDAKLTPWPRVTFQTQTPNVTVKYQRAGDSEVHQANASEKLVLPPGRYDLTAAAPGFAEYSTKLTLTAGYNGVVPLKLEAVPDYQFQDAAQIVHDGAWMKEKDTHAFVHLKPGLMRATLIFAKPGKNLFWNKKVEWRIEPSDNSARVEYVLDGQKLVRRLVNGDQASDLKEAKVDVTAVNQSTSLSVHIEVNGSHVQISNDKGIILDDYVAPHSLSGGRIGFKTDSQFVVR